MVEAIGGAHGYSTSSKGCPWLLHYSTIGGAHGYSTIGGTHGYSTSSVIDLTIKGESYVSK